MNNFSLRSLNSFEDHYDRFEYCRAQGLRHLGSGSYRDVFQLDDSRVLKLDKGYEMLGGKISNEIEYKLARKSRRFFPIIHEVGPRYSWMVVERVIAFSEYTVLKHHLKENTDRFLDECIEARQRTIESPVYWKRKLFRLIRQYQICDIRLYNIGRRPHQTEGIVILDAGYSHKAR